jgi:serine/threonine protein kinase
MAPAENILRGTYQLLEKLGAGGMGEVYAAAHTRLHKRFAVKLLAARHGASSEAYARFRRDRSTVRAPIPSDVRPTALRATSDPRRCRPHHPFLARPRPPSLASPNAPTAQN